MDHNLSVYTPEIFHKEASKQGFLVISGMSTFFPRLEKNYDVTKIVKIFDDSFEW